MATAHGLGTIYRRRVKAADGTERELSTWHVQFSIAGRQYRESAHTDSYTEAQRFLKRRISEITTGKFAGTQADRVLISELLRDVLEDYKLHGRKSVDSFARTMIERHLIPAFGNVRAANLKAASLRAYIAAQRDAGRAVASVNRELALLRRAFNLGRLNGKIGPATGPSFQGLFAREQNARTGFWEHAEYLTFRDALPEDERPVFIFGYWTGCRYSEIVNLRWDQVDLDAGTVRLTADQTKSGEGRVIPMPTALLEALSAQRARHQTLAPESPWVFFRRDGAQVQDIRAAWRAASKATGIEGRLFHDLRRTGVRNLIRAGVPEAVAMRISGHLTRSVFERYNIVSERDLQDAAARLSRYLG